MRREKGGGGEKEGKKLLLSWAVEKRKKNKDIAVGKSMGEQKDGMQQRHGGHRAIMLPGSLRRGGPWGGDLEQ